MDSRNVRYYYCLKSNILNFYCVYKNVFLFCIIALIIGVFLGVFNCINYSADIGLDNMLNTGFVEMLKGDKSSVGLYWFPLIKYLIFCLIIAYTNSGVCKKIFSFIVLIICGYAVSFDISIFVFVYGVLGVINVVLFVVPFQLLFWLCLVIICCIVIKNDSGCNSLNNSSLIYYDHGKLIVFVGALFLFLKYVCLSAIRITIIVN